MAAQVPGVPAGPAAAAWAGGECCQPGLKAELLTFGAVALAMASLI